MAEKKSEQAKRFIEAARGAECSEDEAEIRENMKRIVVPKAPKPETGRQARKQRRG